MLYGSIDLAKVEIYSQTNDFIAVFRPIGPIQNVYCCNIYKKQKITSLSYKYRNFFWKTEDHYIKVY